MILRQRYTILILAIILLGAPFKGHADDLVELEREVEEHLRHAVSEETPELTMSENVELLKAIPKLVSKACQESYTVEHSDRFVTSFDSSGAPCKTYDLKAPHLPLYQSLPRVQLPVKAMGPRAYLSLLRGNDNRTMNILPRYARSFRNSDKEKFWRSLRNRMETAGQNINLNHFKLSELTQEKVEISDEVKASFAALNELKPEGVDFDFSRLESMENVLSMIHLNWDDNTKTYTVSLDEEILKVSRQMVLINYNNPLTLLWEKLFRDVLLNALHVGTMFIPDPIIGNLARIAISDTFSILVVWLVQRILRLETVLRLNIAGEVPTSVSPETLERGLNLLYAHRNGSVRWWLWNSIRTFSFTWANLERIATDRRALVEDRRDEMRTEHLNFLHRRKRCETAEIFENYSVCFRRGEPQAIFNLTTARRLWFFRFGPMIVYHHKRPWEVWTKRVTAWTLSVASRLFNPFIWDPQRASLNNGLSSTLRDLALQGWAEEAAFYENLNHVELDPRNREDALSLRN